ncbi:unnamed protein product [Zymoseptoria tritici ST99CH_1A5]|uniref:Uncharacterized protein n=1 Tax=Zymoseptoria tritici ST99CH_1A5 TaxID=1276529 RepID=A0A1Y6M143_ZYMTR|nr:unnamed protein product [Zymoseptoria tritici ST99CH_1A5]
MAEPPSPTSPNPPTTLDDRSATVPPLHPSDDRFDSPLGPSSALSQSDDSPFPTSSTSRPASPALDGIITAATSAVPFHVRGKDFFDEIECRLAAAKVRAEVTEDKDLLLGIAEEIAVLQEQLGGREDNREGDGEGCSTHNHREDDAGVEKRAAPRI